MDYDAAIIGAGPAGYAAAIRLAQMSKKVVLIERDKIGGECLNYGCIPSKALIELANSINYLKEMPGITLDARVDMKKWQEWKWGMINRLTSGVETLCKSQGVTILKGSAEIMDRNRVKVGDTEVSAENLVIATGSSPVKLPSFEGVSYNREILDIQKIPESLIIVGGGYIGVELGTAFAKLGSKVTIVEMMENILPGVDRELVNPVERRMKALGIQVLTSTKVESVVKEKEIFHVTVSGNVSLEADHILVTVGRKPNTEGFGLEKLGLEMNGKFIKIDSRCETSVKGVYAIGDVSGEPMLAHRAYYQADIAAQNIAGHEAEIDYHAMPFVIYSDPEISYTGKKDSGVSVFPLAANGRALGMNSTTGTYRIYYDSDGTVTGAGIVAPHSSEMISEVTLSVESSLSVNDIALTIHPHPTVSEGLKEAAEGAFGKPLHFKTGR
ncbi:MAG: dihydrolipoyl dehydrogenase [Candidatus Thermoplasmatota archaeon]|nr:dihydrolipoyl dehydrogenase [Candidatus Thermoplasmatota archaeon]MCL5731065.1 dihydrolipoyl dehydrogenase [Candidatus Thermoplasmatota archaeon]